MKRLLLALSFGVMIGCASEPSLQTGPNAETSFDGLVKIDNTVFKEAWMDPDTDLTKYSKVMLADTNFEFRAVKKTAASSSIRTSTQEFSIDDNARQKLIATVREVFTEEVGKSQHFTLTDVAGPEVLIVHSKILDIVSSVPPDMIGRGEIYLKELGSATLVLELADSLSGETLVRASERSKIETQNKNAGVTFAMQSNSATNWADVKRWSRRWAGKFTRGLDSFKQ